jgi:hypothetical protein
MEGGEEADGSSPRRPPEERYQIWRTETTRRGRLLVPAFGSGGKEKDGVDTSGGAEG